MSNMLRKGFMVEMQALACQIWLCRYFAQCDAIGLPREEPHWTSLALRRSQTLQFTNLKRFSRIGAPTASKLGMRANSQNLLMP